jgi:proline dehydrogenase
MKKRIVKLTPQLIKRLIREEKQKIIQEKKEKKKRNKVIVEALRKFLLINKAQKRAGNDFKQLYEQKMKIRNRLIKELKNGSK